MMSEDDPGNAPESDELEVTLLGRGVGESVVVHLLGGMWMVVDSFEQRSKPAAQSYLESIRVDADAVRILVITHFDKDHYVGIDKLHAQYTRARLMITRALRADPFYRLYGYNDPENALPALAGTLRRARERQIAPNTPGLRDLQVGQVVHEGDNVRVKALSPTQAAVDASCSELAAALEAGDVTGLKTRLSRDNRCSVVLHVAAPGSAILLGADLERGPAGFGWQAVLDEPDHRGLQRSTLVKVPHHGSEGANHPGMWDRLVEADPWLVVAPFWPSGLPTSDDVDRLKSQGRAVYRAAPSVGYAVDEFGNRVSHPAETGVIRARRKLGEAGWNVICMEPALLCQ